MVDDEEDLREILRFNLEAEGFEVETAASAEEALDIIEQELKQKGYWLPLDDWILK